MHKYAICDYLNSISIRYMLRSKKLFLSALFQPIWYGYFCCWHRKMLPIRHIWSGYHSRWHAQNRPKHMLVKSQLQITNNLAKCWNVCGHLIVIIAYCSHTHFVARIRRLFCLRTNNWNECGWKWHHNISINMKMDYQNLFVPIGIPTAYKHSDEGSIKTVDSMNMTCNRMKLDFFLKKSRKFKIFRLFIN